jgi:hypothetical protein
LERLIHSPQVSFRGSRTYVHSTTLYEEWMRGARSAGLAICGPMNMRVNRLIVRQPNFFFEEEVHSADCKEPAVISFHVGSSPWRCRISERAQRVTQREVYDEEQIRKTAIVEGSTIRLGDRVDAKPFEIVTSLTLQLHNALLSIPRDRKWYLGRIQLERLLLEEDAEKLQITFNKKAGGMRLTRCAIAVGTTPVGAIDFILGDVV